MDKQEARLIEQRQSFYAKRAANNFSGKIQADQEMLHQDCPEDLDGEMTHLGFDRTGSGEDGGAIGTPGQEGTDFDTMHTQANTWDSGAAEEGEPEKKKRKKKKKGKKNAANEVVENTITILEGAESQYTVEANPEDSEDVKKLNHLLETTGLAEPRMVIKFSKKVLQKMDAILKRLLSE